MAAQRPLACAPRGARPGALARRRVRDRSGIPTGRMPEEMERRARPPPGTAADTPNSFSKGVTGGSFRESGRWRVDGVL